jgi:hypothetical protein
MIVTPDGDVGSSTTGPLRINESFYPNGPWCVPAVKTMAAADRSMGGRRLHQ